MSTRVVTPPTAAALVAVSNLRNCIQSNFYSSQLFTFSTWVNSQAVSSWKPTHPSQAVLPGSLIWTWLSTRPAIKIWLSGTSTTSTAPNTTSSKILLRMKSTNLALEQHQVGRSWWCCLAQPQWQPSPSHPPELSHRATLSPDRSCLKIIFKFKSLSRAGVSPIGDHLLPPVGTGDPHLDLLPASSPDGSCLNKSQMYLPLPTCFAKPPFSSRCGTAQRDS